MFLSSNNLSQQSHTKKNRWNDRNANIYKKKIYRWMVTSTQHSHGVRQISEPEKDREIPNAEDDDSL